MLTDTYSLGLTPPDIGSFTTKTDVKQVLATKLSYKKGPRDVEVLLFILLGASCAHFCAAFALVKRARKCQSPKEATKRAKP